MTFLSPGRLALLALVAGLVVAYTVLERRRRPAAVRFTNLELLASVAPRRPGWRRHLPAAAMALALAGLVVGMARPARTVRVPREAATVVLVLDTSVSMEATDVAPSRLEAAIDAALAFVADLPPRLELGLVSFDRTARVLATPSTDHAAVERGIRSLTTGPGTAAGDAIYAALESVSAAGAASTASGRNSAAVVLLSDGVPTVGRPVEEAVRAAIDQRVPVTTIAFGTATGEVDIAGRNIPVPADPATMAAVAEATGGTFFEALSGNELRSVYEDIGTRVGYRVEQEEVGVAFIGAAAGLLLAALGASLLWSGRIA